MLRLVVTEMKHFQNLFTVIVRKVGIYLEGKYAEV